MEGTHTAGQVVVKINLVVTRNMYHLRSTRHHIIGYILGLEMSKVIEAICIKGSRLTVF